MAETYLVTGVAGTGKSTLRTLFANKGYVTEEVDDGFASWQNHQGETVPGPDKAPAEWYRLHDWNTVGQALIERINQAKQSSQPLIFFGNTGDLSDYTEYFAKIFLLEYHNEELIRQRIYSRTTNDYGKDPVQFTELLSYYRPTQERYRALGAITIDCSLPIDEIASIIESDVRRLTP